MAPSRRGLVGAAVGGATAALASPAIAQSNPTIRWRMASSFPKSFDVMYGATDIIARITSELTEGRFQIQPFAAGEIVPALQVLDAVTNGTVECGQTYMGYYVGRNPAYIFDGSLPFGLSPRQQNAWWYHGGGFALMDAMYAEAGFVRLQAGNTAGQMFGWYRKELKSPADFNGLKIRTAGFGGKVLTKLGAVTQQIPAADTYPALERGTIDATELVAPHDDEKQGFFKVAPFYYAPGVMELEASIPVLVNKAKWDGLPPLYQRALRAACMTAEVEMIAGYDAKNAAAFRSLVAKGAQIRILSPEIIRALSQATEAVLDEEAAASPQFKKILDSWRPFRAEIHRYFSVNDARAEMAVYSR